MNPNSNFSIKSTIELRFKSSQLRNISYTSFLPDLKKLQTKRSNISIEKTNNDSIYFNIESKDITAFRASINEIISFGKIVENTMKCINNS